MLEKAVSICRANENASNDTENLQATASGINRVGKYRKSSAQYQRADSENRFTRKQPWQNRSYEHGYNSKTSPDQRETGAKRYDYRYNSKNNPDQRETGATNRKNQPSQQSQWSGEEKLCRFCGYPWHEYLSQCPAQQKDCAKCGKRGHFAKVCLQYIGEEEDTEDEDKRL